MTHTAHKIAKILAVEGAMHVARKRRQLLLRGIHNEVVGGIIHISHHTVGALDYRLAVTPRYGCGQETCNLPIATTRERVRYAYRVGLDEILAIESIVERLQQVAQLLELEVRDTLYVIVRLCHPA